uniref:phage baseplate protein n=1 Tax=Gemmiger formicilis TaxID=745368 RepID=UPI003AB34513
QTENPTNPALSWPGTSWVQVQNRMLMGASDTYPVGSEGGEAQHTLTVQEIPSHQHQLHGWAISMATSASTQYAPTHPYDRYDNTALTTHPAGGGQPHNNLPPYRSVHIWRRTA